MDQSSQFSTSDTLQPLLKESIHRFLTEYRNDVTDFSNFTSIFSRFLQNLPDPPLEIVWFYSSLTFHSTKYSDSSQREFSVVKDLFQLLISCSSSCSAVKKIAILAPVIYELFHLVIGKNELREDIESLIEGIVCYISICRGSILNGNEEFGDLISCFPDLLRVWMVEISGENCKFGEVLRLFCPVVSDGVRERMASEGYGVGCLAGVVMSEVFLLKLCFKFGHGVSRMELAKDAVQMIRAFQSCYFVDTLLSMLLEPLLPITSLRNSKEEVILREVLYDAAITMEYSFLIPQKGIQAPGEHLKNLAIGWLFVADNAIRFVRENGDQEKVISYLQACSESCLLSQLIKWVTDQPGMQSKTSIPDVYAPVALIKWLLIVEDQGVMVFDSDISKIYAKAIICKSRTEYELLATKLDGKNLDGTCLFNTVNEGKGEDEVGGDLEMAESADTMFLAAPGLMKLKTTNDARKRKEERNEEMDKRVKFFKCNLSNNLAREKVWPFRDDDGLGSGSEVYNPLPVENAVYMEQ